MIKNKSESKKKNAIFIGSIPCSGFALIDMMFSKDKDASSLDEIYAMLNSYRSHSFYQQKVYIKISKTKLFINNLTYEIKNFSGYFFNKIKYLIGF